MSRIRKPELINTIGVARPFLHGPGRCWRSRRSGHLRGPIPHGLRLTYSSAQWSTRPTACWHAWPGVKERTPGFDGARLDDIVDYLTFVFVPLLILTGPGHCPKDGDLELPRQCS